MRNITVTSRLGMLVIIPLAALLLIVGLSIKVFGEIDAGIGRIYDDRVVPLTQLKTIADDYAVLVIDAVNKADHSIISPVIALKQIDLANQRIVKNWRSYMATQLTEEEQVLANQAGKLFDEANQAVTQVVLTLKIMGEVNKG